MDTPSSQLRGATFSCQTAFCFPGRAGRGQKEMLGQIWVPQNHLEVISSTLPSLASRALSPWGVWEQAWYTGGRGAPL